jgi:rRNA maturation endonuclease Nob1
MLPKYFLSFKNIEIHYGQIEKLIIVTNNGLNNDLKSTSSDICLIVVSDWDIIYGEFKNRYKFEKSEQILKMLRNNVEKFSIIAKDLAQSNFQKLGKYKKALNKFVLDKDSRKLKASFIEGPEYAEFKKTYQENYPKINKNLTSNFWGNINKHVKFTSNVEFWKADIDFNTSDDILRPRYRVDEFKEFLTKLEIIVETTIEDINEKIAKISGDKMTSSNDTEDLKNEFDKWIQKNSKLFTDDDLKKLKKTVELKNNLIHLNFLKNDYYERNVVKSGIYLENEDLEMKDFIIRSDIDDNIACLQTSKEQTLINTIRVFRAFESLAMENFVFIRSDISKTIIDCSFI